MVGFVIVSHSQKAAEGVAELGLMMAPDVPVAAAGGMADGGLGTDYEKIMDAVTRIRELAEDGVVIIPDMGSSCMTAEMVLEDLGDELIQMIDCPFLEGAVAAIVEAEGGVSLEEAIQTAKDAREAQKF